MSKLDATLKELCASVASDVRENHPGYDWRQERRDKAKAEIIAWSRSLVPELAVGNGPMAYGHNRVRAHVLHNIKLEEGSKEK